MRLSPAIALALPIFGAAANQPSPIELVKEQFQTYLGPYVEKITPYLPSIPYTNVHDAAEAAAAKAAGSNIDILSLDNWRDIVKPSTATHPEEWWILLTGGNKTCYGLCGQIEKSFNESAVLFAADPTAPHMAMVNCDLQPILCNTWSAGPPQLWIVEVGAPGTKTPIHRVPTNKTTTTAKTFTDLHATESWKELPPYEGLFHPFDGTLHEFGVATPLAYVLWGFSIVPSWAMMILVSFLSRSFMGTPGGSARANPGAATAGRAPAAAQGAAR